MFRSPRLLLSLLGLGLGALSAQPLPAAAADFPSHMVRLVYPFAPGSGGDLISRHVAQGLSKAWGQPVVVENKLGGAGIVGAEYALSLPPDGHTLYGGATTMLSLPIFNKKLPFDPVKDFKVVAITHVTDVIVATNTAVPAKNLQEYVAYARSHPGRLNYASLGRNSVMLFLEWFKQATRTYIVEIPYAGVPQQIDALIRNDVQLMYATSQSMKPFMESGKALALFAISKERLPDFPTVPTNAEVGLPDYSPAQFGDLLVSAKVPEEIRARMIADMVPIMATPEYLTLIRSQGANLFKGTPRERDELPARTAEKMQELARSLKIQPD